jgi:hypothetical protein
MWRERSWGQRLHATSRSTHFRSSCRIRSRTGTPEMERAMGCSVRGREGGGTERGKVEGGVREGRMRRQRERNGDRKDM